MHVEIKDKNKAKKNWLSVNRNERKKVNAQRARPLFYLFFDLNKMENAQNERHMF